ncbi:hypothetical protein DFJ74DRAFT_745549 [Hyaloraphidium curvatum]|nr:hypothetical protein DFJ74DRAFT_745549 [Hyaloraphidium curvatum]
MDRPARVVLTILDGALEAHMIREATVPSLSRSLLLPDTAGTVAAALVRLEGEWPRRGRKCHSCRRPTDGRQGAKTVPLLTDRTARIWVAATCGRDVCQEVGRAAVEAPRKPDPADVCIVRIVPRICTRLPDPSIGTGGSLEFEQLDPVDLVVPAELYYDPDLDHLLKGIAPTVHREETAWFAERPRQCLGCGAPVSEKSSVPYNNMQESPYILAHIIFPHCGPCTQVVRGRLKPLLRQERHRDGDLLLGRGYDKSNRNPRDRRSG